MPIAKITGPGLTAVACSVALLWGSFIAERIMAQRAAAERMMVMRDLRHTQRIRRSEPVSVPLPTRRPARVTAG